MLLAQIQVICSK